MKVKVKDFVLVLDNPVYSGASLHHLRGWKNIPKEVVIDLECCECGRRGVQLKFFSGFIILFVQSS